MARTEGMKRTLVGVMVALLGAACSSPVSSLSDSGTAEPDAGMEQADSGAPQPDSASLSSCSELLLSTTEVQWRAMGAHLVTALQMEGSTGASADFGGDHCSIHAINLALDTSSQDPGEAVVKWLATIAKSPFHADELVPLTPADWQNRDDLSVQVNRSKVAGRASRFVHAALGAFIMKEQGVWRLKTLSLQSSILVASAAEVDALIACTPAAPPPDDSVRTNMFGGLSMRDCLPVGRYTYAPKSNDRIDWKGAMTWVALDANERESAAPIRWRITQPATLTIDPSNYWSNIDESDCLCGGVAGFNMTVDTIKGKVLKATPGIMCAVC